MGWRVTHPPTQTSLPVYSDPDLHLMQKSSLMAYPSILINLPVEARIRSVVSISSFSSNMKILHSKICCSLLQDDKHESRELFFE